jgi:hypothetical protein
MTERPAAFVELKSLGVIVIFDFVHGPAQHPTGIARSRPHPNIKGARLYSRAESATLEMNLGTAVQVNRGRRADKPLGRVAMLRRIYQAYALFCRQHLTGRNRNNFARKFFFAFVLLDKVAQFRAR